jgi:hypothetical protein
MIVDDVSCRTTSQVIFGYVLRSSLKVTKKTTKTLVNTVGLGDEIRNRDLQNTMENAYPLSGIASKCSLYSASQC